MSSPSNKHSEVATFSFQRLYNGEPVEITIAWLDGQYVVLLNKKPTAKIKLDADGHTWVITEGEFNDPELVKEIGERIEARHI